MSGRATIVSNYFGVVVQTSPACAAFLSTISGICADLIAPLLAADVGFLRDPLPFSDVTLHLRSKLGGSTAHRLVQAFD